MIGEKIKWMRKYRGMNQEELGSRLGVSRQYISQVEKGRDSISVKQLYAILEVLDFDVEFNPRESK